MRLARPLEIRRGAVFYQPRLTSESVPALMRRIDELHLEYPIMGARMLRRQLQRLGVHGGRRHLGPLIHRVGIQALCQQPGTSKRHPYHKAYPYQQREGDHPPSQSGLSAGHDPHPDGAWLCLSHGRGGCGQPQGAG